MEFEPTEMPQWRKVEHRTSDMLKEIYNLQCWFRNAYPPLRDNILSKFNVSASTYWVISSNHLEFVGTLDENRTKEICENYLYSQEPETIGKNEEITLRTLIGLVTMFKYRQKMKETSPLERQSFNDSLFLTEGVISEIHEVVLPIEKTHSSPPGVYRRSYAFPLGNPSQMYCLPEDIESKMEQLVDQYNDYVCRLPESHLNNNMEFDIEKTRMVYNLAAWILFHFVNIHPFSDGNGRMCRLIANSVLFNECPFPVYLKGTYTLHDARDIYLKSIIACRNSESQVPNLISAFIIESCLEQWKMFKCMYDDWTKKETFVYRGIPTIDELQKDYSVRYFSELSVEKAREIIDTLNDSKDKADGNYLTLPFSYDNEIEFKVSVRVTSPIQVKFRPKRPPTSE